MDDNDIKTLTGKHTERWERLKKELGNCSSEYIAGLLLDSWYKRKTLFCKKCGAVVSEQEAVHPDLPPDRRTAIKISNVEKPDISVNVNNSDVDDDDDYDVNSNKEEEGDNKSDHVTPDSSVTHSQSEDNWKQVNDSKIQYSEQGLSPLVMENRNGASNNMKQMDVISRPSVHANTNFPSAGILVRNCAILKKTPSELSTELMESSCSGERHLQLPKGGNTSEEKSPGDEPATTFDGASLPHVVSVVPDPPITFENKSETVAKVSSDIEENVEINDSSNSFSIKIEPEDDIGDDNNHAAEKRNLVSGEGVLDMSCSDRESSDNDESCSDNVSMKTTQQRCKVGKRSRRKIRTVKQNIELRRKLQKEKYDESFFGKAKSSYLEQSVEEEKILDEEKQAEDCRRRSGRLKDKQKISFSKMMQYEHKLMESDKELEGDPEDSIEKKHNKAEKKRKKHSTKKHKVPPKKKSSGTGHSNSLVTKGDNPTENLTRQQGHISSDMSEDDYELKVEDLLEQADNMDESSDNSEVHKATVYRRDLKENNTKKYQEYLIKQKQRAKQRRDNVKKELQSKFPDKMLLKKREKQLEQQRLRQKKYREKKLKKGEDNQSISKVKPKPKTRPAIIKQREYNRIAKQKEREKMTYQKKEWIKRKERERKAKKRQLLKSNNSVKTDKTNAQPFSSRKTEYNVTSKVKKTLPNSP